MAMTMVLEESRVVVVKETARLIRRHVIKLEVSKNILDIEPRTTVAAKSDIISSPIIRI